MELWREGRSVAEGIFRRALSAVDPEASVRKILNSGRWDWSGYSRIFLAGIGKAAVPMARAVEQVLGDRLHSGLAVVKYGHGGQLERTVVREAGHPQPDESGVAATRELTEFLDSCLRPGDLLILLISGGGSALSPAPAPPLTLADKQQVTRALIAGGAGIAEINAIRKHLSRVKGGRLLDFTHGARVLCLVLSDVIGDDLSAIASGPAFPDPTTYADCLAVVERYGLEEQFPAPAMELLRKGASGGAGCPAETPKPGDPRFDLVENVLVGTNSQALQAAADEAAARGFRPLVLTSSLDGDTGEAAKFHLALLREVLASGHPVPAPCCLISGGETTVVVRGDGLGGRNQEFVLHCVLPMGAWHDRPVLVASLGTDGSDGPTDAAGAWADSHSWARARLAGLDPLAFLARNDSYHFFDALGDLIRTGPTLTNVMDLRLVLVGAA